MRIDLDTNDPLVLCARRLEMLGEASRLIAVQVADLDVGTYLARPDSARGGFE